MNEQFRIIAQNYCGMIPKDKGITTWGEMQQKMVDEIEAVVKNTSLDNLSPGVNVKTMRVFQNFDNSILKNPEFENAQRVHDWRNYVCAEFIKGWDNFTLREKQIIYIISQEQADKEEWD